MADSTPPSLSIEGGDLEVLLDSMVEAMDETQQEFGESTAWHDLARAALGAVRQEVPVALYLASRREQAFRTAVELTVQDVRAQRGDHIASLVEDSFHAHFSRADISSSRDCSHDWEFDGYFWHHCRACGAVS